MLDIPHIANEARKASIELAAATTEERNHILSNIKECLIENIDSILESNKIDVENSKQNCPPSLLSRLELSREKLLTTINGIDQIISLSDPINQCTLATEVSPDQFLYRVTCPIGVLGIIFEARPEASIQIASLGIKSGNSVILKGGKESKNTMDTISKIMQKKLEVLYNGKKLTKIIQILHSRDDIQILLKQTENIDLIIPRGSKELIQSIRNQTSIPVLSHSDGICSVYVNENCDFNKAIRIIIDSKMNYPSACNAMESLIIDETIFNDFMEEFLNVLDEYLQNIGKIEVYAFNNAYEILNKMNYKHISIKEGIEYYAEFLNYNFNVFIVKNCNEAIEHINRYNSHHTDTIVSNDNDTIEMFLQKVDSASVFANVSTRFADGFRYGFGAEVGISTNRIHARGPVGLDGLVIYKYRMYGNGQVVGEFGQGKKQYTHMPISNIHTLEDIKRKHTLSAFEIN